ncbi:hypothetical protein ACFV0O_11795 [Kitasatospora sp. NPDC059577]|uniref:hypothetical protein n=1 Tax=Kitasatospora sp. NPDC059577 TaxID=3346873 RepID=UPI0036B7EAC1
MCSAGSPPTYSARPGLIGAAGAAGLGHPALLKLAFRLIVNLTEPNSRDALDRLLHVIGKIALSNR